MSFANRDHTLLYPVFAAQIMDALQAAQTIAPGLRIFEGWRSPAEQTFRYEQGRAIAGSTIVTDAQAWHSWHQYGLACDVAVKHPDGKWSWEFDTAKVREIMLAHGLERGPQFEECHFQLTRGLSIDKALDLNRYSGLQSVWLNVEARL